MRKLAMLGEGGVGVSSRGNVLRKNSRNHRGIGGAGSKGQEKGTRGFLMSREIHQRQPTAGEEQTGGGKHVEEWQHRCTLDDVITLLRKLRKTILRGRKEESNHRQC